MTKPIYIISRQGHIDHFFRVIPIIFVIYCAQCFLFKVLFPSDISIQIWIFTLGAMLLTMMGIFLNYDLHHKVEVFENQLSVKYPLLFINKVINIHEIEDIIVAQPGAPFSNLLLKLNNGKKMTFYFVDEAENVAKLIIGKQINYSQAA